MIQLDRTRSTQESKLRILAPIFISLIVVIALYSSMIEGSTALSFSSSGNTANTTKLIYPNATNFNKTGIGSTNIVSAPGQLLTYINSTNKIRLEYPSTWAIDDGYNGSGTNSIVADAFPKISLDNTSSTNAFVHITKSFMSGTLDHEVYIHRILAAQRNSFPDLRLITLRLNNTAGTLGHPGFEFEYISTYPNSTTLYDVMRIGKFVGNTVYYISFSTPYLSSNSDLLIKQAKEIGDSIQVLNATR